MMKQILLTLLLLSAMPAMAAKEDDYVEAWCKERGVTEFILPDKARVDCLTLTYAVEADYAPKWAESIGQTLYYASQTGRKPAILLIVGPRDWRYVERLFEAIQRSGTKIRVFFIQKESIP